MQNNPRHPNLPPRSTPADFANEQAVVGALLRCGEGLPAELGSKEFTVSVERQVGSVIPDVLLIRGPAAPVTPAFAELGFVDWAVAAALFGSRQATTGELASVLHTRKTRIEDSVIRLARMGLLSQSSTAERLIPRRLPLSKYQVIAIEAKLSRWRDAVKQAASYREFANRSYVALPSELLKTIPEIKHEARVSRVGLLAVDHMGARVVRHAPFEKVRSADWLRLVLGNHVKPRAAKN